MKPDCVVIFPLYKQPTALELAFLEHGLAVLKGVDAVIVAPQTLSTEVNFGTLSSLPVVRFENHYFKDIQGYNRLLLSETFYQAFSNYAYILIHQADVYLFKDALSHWCAKKYDYIGAPWFRPPATPFKKIYHRVRKIIQKNYGIKHNKVGNGGFSLRNVTSALDVLSKAPGTLLEQYRSSTHHLFNEDVFWSLEVPKINKGFLIPPVEEALSFSIEFNPETAVQLLHGELPFGCHAPLVHGKDFWKKYIPEIR